MVVPEKFDDQLLLLLEDILHGIVYQGAESHSLSVKKEVPAGDVKPCTTAESIVYGLTTGNVFFQINIYCFTRKYLSHMPCYLLNNLIKYFDRYNNFNTNFRCKICELGTSQRC